MKICGIDASTSTIGISINEDGKVIFASFIDISKLIKNKDKCMSFIDKFKLQLESSDIINLEAALGAFAHGFTSAKTIVLLARFNGILEYIIGETFPNKIINLVNVNTCRKCVFGMSRIKGIKPKIFVQMQLEKLIPDLHKFDIINKRGLPDKRNSDIYDAIVLSLYNL